MKKIGFIGAGNMGGAILGGILNSKMIDNNHIIASAKSDRTIEKIKNDYNVNVTKDSKEVVEFSDLIVIGVKPDIYDEILEEIKDLINDKIIITIAAGKTIEAMEKIIGDDKKILRTMPNTPSLVGEGMTSLSPNKNISEEELSFVKSIFDSLGKSEVVKEDLIHAVIGASGSSTAYAFMFIEAIADGAVRAGMPRDKAYTFASQGVLGAAKMVLDTGKHPGELKDMVCSPGGTTIEAVKVLEEEKFRGAVLKAIESCINKSIEMSK
ncbi:MAG: pyrroline-5-carboxylate reductase [Terrisporobacter othiniensis]|uniref:pyrroline-5-carboxylate reductase n=1 Tax=Terrisporobacter petrolearius TaxID=1460447 RepID=UPI0022E74EE6|nr:pyrroline-5-carboxylate reductase [Terrisporobacter petrolearius]MDU4862061.1 pyrroline-5-carboxylate reductase [Terrisporobacter othiniensis]MDU6995697.1 pyrroline-5-carboxylate reductase [Terrisporobacter othiniensis]